MEEYDIDKTAHAIMKLQSLDSMGFCWSIGSSRVNKCQCRIFTKTIKPWHKTLSDLICITESGNTLHEAIEKALTRLNDRV